MRLALATLIAVTQLVGPWLCCCGPGRIAAAFDSTAPAANKSVPTCPHCAGAGAEAAEPGWDAPKPAHPLPDRCPCGGVELVAVPADKGERHAPSVAALLVPVSAEPNAPLPVESFTPADLPGLRGTPHLTTSDRLYVHHALRC
jgi:hypothetical protein